MSSTACDDQFNDPPIETSEAEARPYAGGAPENIRAGDPYDDPEFERLAREHDVWGRADSALCAVFWLAGKAQLPSGQGAAQAGDLDWVLAQLKSVEDGHHGGDPMYRRGFVGALAVVAGRIAERRRAQPAAATVPADAQAISDAALEVAARVCESRAGPRVCGAFDILMSAAYEIRNLKGNSHGE